ncbi:hypothetical protein MA16_Dca023193 [Dendrobium catenatum]|uniref:Uncharacterized protein n=1 Tax=Dendrobium catenatum TaxID=906689 RepID=A0A2I0VE90_9ASPA|nr:hypothetical protein MA16_Dca023193 [Dendrobium catenatum]
MVKWVTTSSSRTDLLLNDQSSQSDDVSIQGKVYYTTRREVALGSEGDTPTT